jgi:pheromone shutdown protein TraB
MPEQGTVTIVPSVHFSPTHRRRVRETIREKRPDLVAVELDERRFDRLERRARTGGADLAAELPTGTAPTRNALQAIQRTVVRLYGLDPEESDMETAIRTAAELETEIALVDEPLDETLAELSDAVGLETIPKLLLRMGSMGPRDRLQQLEMMTLPMRDVRSGDDVAPLVDQMRKLLPELTEVLLDRRDRAMAERLHVLRHEGYDVVAVVGAAHHNGILAALDELEATNAEPDVSVPIRTSTRSVTHVPIE